MLVSLFATIFTGFLAVALASGLFRLAEDLGRQNWTSANGGNNSHGE